MHAVTRGAVRHRFLTSFQSESMERRLVTHHNVSGEIELAGQGDVPVTAAASLRNVEGIHGGSRNPGRLDLVLSVARRADRGGNDTGSYRPAMDALFVLRINLGVARSADPWNGFSEGLGTGPLHLVYVAVTDGAVRR